MVKVHIDENVSIKTGEFATEIFDRQNDKEFLSENGVVKITKQRWSLAQSTEAKHWMDLGKNSNDDRNYEHASLFNNYKDLANIKFESVIELGCGPFTNLRVIANTTDMSSCSLLDPLIDQYLTHPYCAYGNKITLNSPKNIKINKLFNIPAEELPQDQIYDLVVCINVIEHCFDAEAVLNKMYDICLPNGFVVFSEKLHSYEQAKKSVDEVYDAAHPIRLGKDLFEKFANKFDIKQNTIISVRNDLIEATQDYVYFIGQKK